MKKPIIAGLVVLALLIACVAAGPFITVHKIRDAVKARDQAALAAQVDFPLLRSNLKQQFNDRLTAEMASGQENNAFASFGLVLAGKLADVMVDALVTPAALARLMSGEKAARLPRREPDADVPEGGSGPDAGVRREPLADASYHFSSPSRFVARVTGKDGKVVDFVLTRDGLSWRLTNILLPL